MRTALVVALLWANAVMANDDAGAARPEPADPNAARIADLQRDTALLEAQRAALEAKQKLIAAETAVLTERFGETPQLPTGQITGENHLASLSGALLIRPMNDAAKAIAATVAAGNDCPKSLLITSTADRREQVTVAASIQIQAADLASKLDETVNYINRIKTREAGASSLTTDGIMASLGALEKLMGVFRADYTIGSVTVNAETQAFRLAVANAISSATWNSEQPCRPAIRVDGMTPSDLAPLLGSDSTFMTTIDSVRSKLSTVDAGLAAASEGVKQTVDYQRAKGVSARVTAFLTRGDTVVEGKTLFEKIAAQGGWSTPSERVLYVDLVGVGAATMKVTRWFSLRNTVHVVVSGQAPYAYINGNNEVLTTGVQHLHHTASINLAKLSKATTATDLFSF